MSTTPVSPTRSRLPRPEVPFLEIRVPFEGRLTAYLRNCRNVGEEVTLRRWLELDDELAELCDSALRLRDRRAA